MPTGKWGLSALRGRSVGVGIKNTQPIWLYESMHRTKRRQANHIRGARGIDIVRKLLPVEWVVRELTPDYGLDLHVEVFNVAPDDPLSADTLGEHFFAQVKTVDSFDIKTVKVAGRKNVSKHPLGSPDGDPSLIPVISCVLDVAEIRTIEEMGTAVPVLLVVVDRSAKEARYICLNDWVGKVLLPSNPDYERQGTVTVHVPAWNVFDSGDLSFASIWLLARRSKFYAAFASFSYQFHELERAISLADYAASSGFGWNEAVREEGVLEMLDVFLRSSLRLGIWSATGGGSWRPLEDVHADLMDIDRRLRDGASDDVQAAQIAWSSLEAFRRADNLSRMYEELCREWGLPTELAAQIANVEAAERERVLNAPEGT